MASTTTAPPRPPVDIDVLGQFLQSIQSLHQEFVQDLDAKEKLCHYTTLDGARSILTECDLWLTNTRFSNDDQELKYGQDLVEKFLKAESLANPARAGFLDRVLKDVKKQEADQVYICCFCEEDDLLGQWRGYAENGGGVSIQFDPEFFRNFTGSDAQNGLTRLWKVFYEEPKQTDIIRCCIDHAWPGATEDDKVRYTVDAIQFFIPTFKNSAFKDEKERRLIFTPKSTNAVKPMFRVRRGVLLPYFSLQELGNATDPTFALKVLNVTIGPSHNGSLNKDSMNFLLKTKGHSGIEATLSPIPYRG